MTPTKPVRDTRSEMEKTHDLIHCILQIHKSDEFETRQYEWLYAKTNV